MQTLEIHPAANVFPLMDEDCFSEFKESIRQYGQQEKIVLYEEMILDGRNRYRACQELGIDPEYKTWSGGDPMAYVIAANLHRRHLTPSQRSMCAGRAREWYDGQAKERQRQSEGRGKKGPVNLPDLKGDARDQAGKAFGVSGSSVDHATKVLNNAIPEVIQAVDEGKIPVHKAAVLSTEPEEVQMEEVAKPKGRKGKSHSNGKPESRESDPDNNPEDRKSRGKGVELAYEAINCLSRIPKNDALRKLGFQLVKDWIKRNP